MDTVKYVSTNYVLNAIRDLNSELADNDEDSLQFIATFDGFEFFVKFLGEVIWREDHWEGKHREHSEEVEAYEELCDFLVKEAKKIVVNLNKSIEVL